MLHRARVGQTNLWWSLGRVSPMSSLITGTADDPADNDAISVAVSLAIPFGQSDHERHELGGVTLNEQMSIMWLREGSSSPPGATGGVVSRSRRFITTTRRTRWAFVVVLVRRTGRTNAACHRRRDRQRRITTDRTMRDVNHASTQMNRSMYGAAVRRRSARRPGPAAPTPTGHCRTVQHG